jgi:hypothetical protein
MLSSSMCSMVAVVRQQRQQQRLIRRGCVSLLFQQHQKQKQHQHQQCRSLITTTAKTTTAKTTTTTTTTTATTTTKLKEVVVVGGVIQQQHQQQHSLLLLNPFSTMSMSTGGSKTSKRTMMTASSTSNNNNNNNNNSIISNRGGAIIPNLLSKSESKSGSGSKSGMHNIHLPSPDDPVGLQLYKKVIYCPITNILRTSLHIGTDDYNQKVNGIVVGSKTVANDDNDNNDGRILISSKDANNHARNSGLRLLSSIHHYLNGDLSRVEQILNLTGIVNVGVGSGHNENSPTTGSDFKVPPYGNIIDGCSQVLAEAFGPDIGIGTRVCFGGSIGSTVACYVELRIRPL